ncbi:MAG: hypothetical protein WC052_04570, partial [Patescibacteria group bacterium]
YNRHMYEKLYAASHDVKNHSRAARRSMWKQAGRHLAEWKKPLSLSDQFRHAMEEAMINGDRTVNHTL